MIQCWVIIKEGPELTDEELGQVMQLGADQYQKVGLSHDGLELLHCIIDPEVVPVIEAFLAARQQEPEIVKATTISGKRYGFEFDEDLERLVQVLDEVFPDDPELFDSFFPMVQPIDDGVPRVNIIYDEHGEPTGETEPVMIATPRHQFAGWGI